MKYEVEYLGGQPFLVTHHGCTKNLSLTGLLKNDLEIEVVLSNWIKSREGKFNLVREGIGVALKPLLVGVLPKNAQDVIDEVIIDFLEFKGQFLADNYWCKNQEGGFTIYELYESPVAVGEVASTAEVQEYFCYGTTTFLTKY